MILSSTKFLQKSQSIRNFRSKSALESLSKSSEDQITNLILYNYPSFSGSFAALFAHLYHSHLNLPHLILPFSLIQPLKLNDLNKIGFNTCYLLDFIGPKQFAIQLSQSIPRVIVFDHRKSSISKVPNVEDRPDNLKFNIDIERSSSRAVYDYFSKKIEEKTSTSREVMRLVKCEDKDRVEMLLRYVEDGDLRRWSLPDIKEFNIGLHELRSQLNCITNSHMFDQLLALNAMDLVAMGNAHLSSRQDAAKTLSDRAFKVSLGRGLYGECLGVRIDGNSHLSNETGRELAIRSAAAGLRVINVCEHTEKSALLSVDAVFSESDTHATRPIGAVGYMQRNNLKMCLRSVDADTNTSEVAKAYGGGGTPGSSSFIIRMDEFNLWISAKSS